MDQYVTNESKKRKKQTNWEVMNTYAHVPDNKNNPQRLPELQSCMKATTALLRKYLYKDICTILPATS